jgi:hypothetical protein
MHALVMVPVVMLFVLVGYRLITGQIRTAGMLCDDNGDLSAERVQLLLASVAGLAAYGALVLSSRATGTPAFPDVPDNLLPLLGGSHGIYLLRKWMSQR